MKERISRWMIGALLLLPSPIFASGQCDGLSAVGGSCSPTDLPDRLDTVINALFLVAGAIAVLIIVVGGIRYITSTGDSKRIQAAKDTILYAVIGLVIVILARAIIGFVIGQFAPS